MPRLYEVGRPKPSDRVFVSEVFVNKTRVHRFGHSEPYDTGRTFARLGEVFRDLQREYGGCTSKVYLDNPEDQARPHAVGWVFEKRMPYEDDPRQSYLREVWVEVHRGPSVETTTAFLARLA